MFNSNLGRYFLVASFIFSLLNITGCGSDSSNKSGDSEPSNIVVLSPSTISWEEGEVFIHSIETNQKSELSYSLLDSEDSSLFVIDEKTGIVSGKEPFDYESPKDADTNGIYKVKFSVSNSNNEITTQDLSISITNKREYQLSIEFPVNNGNLGGSAKNVSVRGKLNTLSPEENYDPDLYTIKVNGIEASVDEDSNWSAKIPVGYGENVITAYVEGETLIDSEEAITLQNSLIVDQTTAVTSGADWAIYLSIDRKFILEKDLTSDSISTLATTDIFKEINGCDSFSGLSLVSDQPLLVVNCQLDDLDGSNMTYIYSLNFKEIHTVGRNAISSSERVISYGHDNIIFDNNLRQFKLLNIYTGDLTLVEKPFPTYQESIDYINSSRDNKSLIDLVEIDGQLHLFAYIIPTMQERDNAVNADIEFHIILDDNFSNDLSSFFNIDVHLSNNRIFIFEFPKTFEFDFDGNLLNRRTIDTSEISSSSSQDIIFASNNRLIFGNRYRSNRYSFDIETFKIENFLSVQPDVNFGYYEYTEIDHSIKGFSTESNEIWYLDLRNMVVENYAKLDESTSGLNNAINFTRYDAYTDRFLISNFSKYGPNPLSDQPIFSSFDLKNMSLTNHFSLDDFHAYLNLEDGSLEYTIEYFAPTENVNEVIFGATIHESNVSLSQGIFKYNLETKEFLTIVFNSYTTIDGMYDNRIPYRVSNYYEGLDGYILTNWGNGSVRLLENNGKISTLVPNQDEFPVTALSIFNQPLNQIFYSGIYHQSNPNGSISTNSFINRLAMEARDITQIADTQDKDTLNIKGHYFALDSNRQLMYQIQNDSVLIIDIESNERILVPFTVTSN